MLQSIRSGLAIHDDNGIFIRRDGSRFPVEFRSHPLHFDQRLLGAVITFSDITLRKIQEQKIWRQANFDALTGLANRSLFQEQLQAAIRLAGHAGTRLALLYVDLDGFKQVNDRYGHAVGDDLLRIVSKRLSGGVRESDWVARLGGDEFTVCLETVHGREDARVVAEKILQEMSRPFMLDDVEIVLSASIGIALFPDDARSMDKLLQLADGAMYKAKQQGRNRWLFHIHEE